MKKFSKVLGFMLIIGCSMEPDAPRLISPQSGAVFDSLPITFTWSSDANAEGYVLEATKTTNGLGEIIGEFDGIYQYTNDTVYSLTQAEFDNLEDTTYYWHVASFWTEEGETLYNWSKYRSFAMNKPVKSKLFEPDNGEEFDSVPPTFVWSKEVVDEYYLMVFKDSLWSKDTLAYYSFVYYDTSFALSMNDLMSADRGSYAWTVAVEDTSGKLIYPTPRIFRIRDFTVQTLDLDTTYFPFGLGYEWCYEYHYVYDEETYSEPIHEEYWDTVIITVTDSFWQNKTLVIDLSGSFVDVGTNVEIWGNKLEVFGVFTGPVSYYAGGTISLIPEEYSSTGFSISYRGDTLHLYSGYDEDSYVGVGWMDTYRLRGIGVIDQSHGEGHRGTQPEVVRHDHHLLWFYNGQDTVYKAPE